MDPNWYFSEVSVEKKEFFSIPEEAEYRISLIQELIDMYDNIADAMWSTEDIDTNWNICAQAEWRIIQLNHSYPTPYVYF